jgi:hypothetical protein
MKRFLALALALAASAGTLAAQGGTGTGTGVPDQLTNDDPSLPTTRVGTRGAAFLNLPVGARAQSMAGAYAAMADDISALYWNTAGIAQIDGFALGASSARLFDDLDINHLFVGAVIPMGLSRLGVSVNMLSSGEMFWQSETHPNAGFGGEQDPLRTAFEWQGLAVGLHLARPITDRLVFGGALKFIQEGITGAQADYFAIDLGTTFRTGLYGISLGASLQNLGGSGNFEGQLLQGRVNTADPESNNLGPFIRILETKAGTNSLEIPTTFRFSVMADLIGDATAMISPNPDNALRVVWDLNDAIDTDLQTALGLEYGYKDLAFVRAGKRWFNESQINHSFSRGASIGAGLHLPIGETTLFRLDYAYTAMEDLQNVQVFTLDFMF